MNQQSEISEDKKLDGMDDKIISDVNTIFKLYKQGYQKNNFWRSEAERMIKEASNGEVRAFHLFFNNPRECISGSFQAQYLEWKDVRAMYPQYEKDIKRLSQGKFLMILHCKNVLSNR
jgi:hypothetical protein